MALSEPWSIKSRAHICTVTELHFVDGESFYTAIFPDPESSGYLRKDFSMDGWENRSTVDKHPFSFWQSVYHPPLKEAEMEVSAESPEDLLRRLVNEDEDHTENVRYILAIMLERKKQLKEADTQFVSDGIIRIYEQRKTGDVFIIKDPNIPLSEIENVQQEISDLLESGGRKAATVEEKSTEEGEITEVISEGVTEESSLEETIVSEENLSEEE